MARTILFLLFFIFSSIIFSQSYDQNYTAVYALKDARGTEISRFKHYRNGNKLRFNIVQNSGMDNEKTIDIYIFKDEGKVYTVTAGRGYKTGSRHALDMSFIGMQTGVYILDLGNDGSIFNSNSRNGTNTVLGNTCTIYTLATQGDAKSEYSMYQDNLMLKRVVGSPTEGNTLEAASYDPNANVPESMFTLPTDVQFLDY